MAEAPEPPRVRRAGAVAAALFSLAAAAPPSLPKAADEALGTAERILGATAGEDRRLACMDALPFLEIVSDLVPEYAYAVGMHAECLFLTERYAAAAPLLERYIGLVPGWARTGAVAEKVDRASARLRYARMRVDESRAAPPLADLAMPSVPSAAVTPEPPIPAPEPPPAERNTVSVPPAAATPEPPTPAPEPLSAGRGPVPVPPAAATPEPPIPAPEPPPAGTEIVSVPAATVIPAPPTREPEPPGTAGKSTAGGQPPAAARAAGKTEVTSPPAATGSEAPLPPKPPVAPPRGTATRGATPPAAAAAGRPGLTQRQLIIRLGYSPLAGVLGAGAEFRMGRVGIALGTGGYPLTGGFSVGSPDGGLYLDLHVVWMASSLFVDRARSTVAAGATGGFDWRPRPWLSVKVGLGVFAAPGVGAGLTWDACAGPVLRL